jgi:hypothetical protein
VSHGPWQVGERRIKVKKHRRKLMTALVGILSISAAAQAFYIGNLVSSQNGYNQGQAVSRCFYYPLYEYIGGGNWRQTTYNATLDIAGHNQCPSVFRVG